ncbi:hypothetical protein [Gordonia sp. NPDC003429]
MTAATAPVEASHDPPDHGHRQGEHTVRVLAVRWVILVAATVIAYWSHLDSVLQGIRSQTVITYVPAALLLTAMAAYGVTLRRGPELPIYDRQTDVIVGVILLGLSLSTDALLAPRFTGGIYFVTHLDLLGLWGFVLGASVLLFGLRPVARYRWVWLLGLSVFPIPMRILALLMLGGTPFAAGAAMVILAVMASMIAVGRTRRLAVAGGLIAGGVGVILLFAVQLVHPSAPTWVFQTLPPVGCVLVTGVVAYVARRRNASPRPFDRPLYPPAVAQVGRGPWACLLVVTVLSFFVRVPPLDGPPSVYVPGLNTRPPLTVPSDWVQLTGAREYDWVSRLYGPNSLLVRQELVQRDGDPAFDKFARPRKVVADSIETARPAALQLYPLIFIYDLVGDRISPRKQIPLAHNVTGRVFTVVDDTNYLTYNLLWWEWNNGTYTQQVTLWAVDNHETWAPFPEPKLTVVQNLNTLVTAVLRGNSVVEDLKPNLKDEALLVGAANDLIDAQVASIPQAGAS